MTPSRPARLYTLDEARALVPRLRALLTALRVERRQLVAETEALRKIAPAMRGNGHAVEASRHEERVTELTAAIRGKLGQIAAMGIEVKDLETGLVDFPTLRDGRIVYLCWRADEPTVAYWHELDAGLAGRQHLDE